jgi:wyosine [tRNA(Phe)-imidazoG37] synthetase (radical SAM superfamily)
MNIIFGPIVSRRFGKSLGIDLSPQDKQCNFDCIYCELGKAETKDGFTEVLPVDSIVEAVKKALSKYDDIDVLTLTANGEPTLYPHLAELTEALDRIRGNRRTLILSNASTIYRPEIRETLRHIDTVKLSLDCATPRCFRRIDRPDPSVDLDLIKKGMLIFSGQYHGNLIIEVLVVKGINDSPDEIKALNDFFMLLRPERIDLGTIDRPPAYRVDPVSYERLRELSLLFDPSLRIHLTSRRDAGAITPSEYDDKSILATLGKRPLTPDDITVLFDIRSRKRLENLLEKGKIKEIDSNGVKFYIPS